MASIKQLSARKYKITVSNGYRPDGRKISKAKTITVPDSIQRRGIRQYVAHAAEEFEREVKNGYSEDGEMTFEEYAIRWLTRQTKYAPSTLASYRRMLDRVYPYIGSIKLNKLRPMALENMMLELRKRTCRGKPVQEKTAQKYLTVVSAVLSDAKRNEIIQRNPARMIDLPATRHREQFIPTVEEAQRLLQALAKEPRHFRVFYLLAMATGCRRGELCALKWSDFRSSGDGFLLTVSRSRSIDKQTVAELAGHADTGFLERTYCHPEMARKRDAAASMLTSIHPGGGMLFPIQTALGKYVELWLRDIAPHKLAKSTLARDKQDIARFLPHLGNYKLTDLRPEHFRSYYAELRNVKNSVTGKPLSEHTVEGVHACICGILSDAMEGGYLDHNPAWRTYKYSGKKKEKTIADEETMRLVMKALEKESIKYETYFKLIIATGMRRGECCGLKWSDIDFKNRAIHVQRNVVKITGEEMLNTGTISHKKSVKS